MKYTKKSQIKLRKSMNNIGDALVGIGIICLLICASADIEMTQDMTPSYVGCVVSIITVLIGLGINRLFPLPEEHKKY